MTTSADSLEALAAAAVAGDRVALARVCERLQTPLFRLALRMLVDAADAEDATQEILVKVVTHLGEFQGRSGLLTWAHAIAARHLLRLRRGRREAVAPTAEGLAEALDRGMQVPAKDALSEGEARLLEREVRLSCTYGMLLVLSREERLAIVLAEVLGFDGPTAAVICDVSPDVFRQRLARGRASLRPLLEQRCGLVDAANPCRCSQQVHAKRAYRGLGVETLVLSPLVPSQPEEAERLQRAARELRGLERMRLAFVRDAEAEAPPRLLERLRQHMPTLLGAAS